MTITIEELGYLVLAAVHDMGTVQIKGFTLTSKVLLEGDRVVVRLGSVLPMIVENGESKVLSTSWEASPHEVPRSMNVSELFALLYNRHTQAIWQAKRLVEGSKILTPEESRERMGLNPVGGVR